MKNIFILVICASFCSMAYGMQEVDEQERYRIVEFALPKLKISENCSSMSMEESMFAFDGNGITRPFNYNDFTMLIRVIRYSGFKSVFPQAQLDEI